MDMRCQPYERDETGHQVASYSAATVLLCWLRWPKTILGIVDPAMNSYEPLLPALSEGSQQRGDDD